MTDAVPLYLNRRQAAEYVSQRYFAVSHRAIERWPLTIYRPGKRALHSRAELDELAQAMIENSQVSAA